MFNRLAEVSLALETKPDAGSGTFVLFGASSLLTTGRMVGLDTATISLIGNGKLQGGLADIYIESQAAVGSLRGAARDAALHDFVSSNAYAPIHSGYVTIDVAAANGDGSSILDDLAAIGLIRGAAFGATASGLISVDKLDELAALDTVKFAHAAFAVTHTGSVTGQDDLAIDAPDARTTYGVSGAGIKIGILSDSFDAASNPLTDYADDVASGDLPAGVEILSELVGSGGSDEGRAMAQLIYDIAPGVDMAFHSAFNGAADFAQGIIDLYEAGSQIIVDDVTYFNEPMFMDGIIAQAVDTVVNQGAMYFSSAGNFADRSYEAAFNNSGQEVTISGKTYQLHDFDSGASVDTTIRVSQAGGVNYLFQWDDPFFSVTGSVGSRSDMALIFFNTNGTLLGVIDTANFGNDPLEIAGLTGSGQFDIAFGYRSDLILSEEPNLIKLVTIGGQQDFLEHDTGSATSFGHSNAAGANSVGAADWYDTPAFGVNPPAGESFTSKGGVPILFDVDGNRYISPQYRGVDFTAPDGSNNTFFGQDAGYDADALPNFYGTSAAAPNAAALAALMMEYAPDASGARIEQALKDSALDILESWNGIPFGIGFDPWSGAGLIQGTAALAALDDDTGSRITVTRQTVFPTDLFDTVVNVGEELHTTVRIVNNGVDDADGVQLFDPLNGSLLDESSIEITPIANNDNIYGVGATSVFTFAQLLANDVDPDGDAANLTITGVLKAQHGTVSIDFDADTITFVREVGYGGAASFEYTIVDEDGHANVIGYNGRVTMNTFSPRLAGADEQGAGTNSNSLDPLASIGTLAAGKAVEVYYTSTVGYLNELVNGSAESAAVVTSNGGNDIDTSNVETLTVADAAEFTLSLGNLVFLDANRNGTFDAGDSGIVDHVVSLYVDADEDGVADGAALASMITGADGGYLFTGLAAGSYVIGMDTPVGLGVLEVTANGGDPDNNVDNDSNAIAGVGGSVTSGTITIAAGMEPTDDGDGDSNTNLTVDFGFRVVMANTPPVAQVDSYNADEDTVLEGTSVLVNDTDADDDDLTAELVTDALNGTVVLNADGTFLYTPDPDFNGEDFFTYRAFDGSDYSDAVKVTINVAPVNDAPVIESNGGGETANVSIDEGTTAVTTVVASDIENDPITYSITGGADASLFTIDGMTGALSFITAPDFDNPTDAGANNVYDVQVSAFDGELYDAQDIAVTVNEFFQNQPPEITSDGGGDTASISIAENTNAVTTVTAIDDGLPTQTPTPTVADIGPVPTRSESTATNVEPASGLTYSIVGGIDSGQFTIDATTGALSFIAAPDFEIPGDEDGNNIYEVIVRASDGELFDDQEIAVTVTNVKDAPTVSIGLTAQTVWDQIELDPDDAYNISALVQGENFTLTAPVVLDVFEVLIQDDEVLEDNELDGFSGILSWAIYAAGNDGQPGDFLISGSDSNPVLTDTGALAFGTDVFHASISLGGVSLEAGDYWIMLHEGDWLSPGDGSTIWWMTSANDPDPSLPSVSAVDETNPVYSPNTGPGFLAFRLDQNADNTLEATEQVPLNLAGQVQIDDQDAGAGEITVTLTVASGVLDIAAGSNTVSVTDDGTSEVKLTGTLAQIQSLLAGSLGATLTYTADSDDPPATDTLTVIVDDEGNTGPGGPLSATATATIEITAVNDAPVISSNGGDDTAAIDVVDATTTVTTVVATDPEGETVSYAITGGADQALFTIDAGTGALSFITAPDFDNPTDAGADNVYDVIVTASDGELTDSQAIAVTVVEEVENTPPVATNDSYTVNEDVTLNVNAADGVLFNDTDADADPLTAILVTGPAHGTLTLNADGSFSYRGVRNFNGTDSFTYRANDGSADGNVATVTINVNPVNDAPVVALPIADQSSPEDTPFSFTLPAGTFTDVDSPVLTLSATLSDNTELPSWLNFDPATGTFSGTPPQDFAGSLDVRVFASDGMLSTSDVFTLTITPDLTPPVPVNNPPIARDDSVLTQEGVPITISAALLLANDSDIDGNLLNLTNVFGASRGTVSLVGSTITYTPPADFTGTATFSYTVTDGFGGSDTGLVTVIVREPPNMRPVVSPAIEDFTTFEGTALSIQVMATDADGDPLTYTVSGNPLGSVTGGTGGAFVYTPDEGFTGSDRIIVVVSDGQGGTAQYEAGITVIDATVDEEFRLLTTDGWTGEIGGNGTVFGTEGFQDITVLDVAGHVSFEPSFNAGNDIIRLSGDASAWDIVRFGSNAVLSDGDTVVTIPVGVVGQALVFDDGVRALAFDTATQTMSIGDQSFGNTFVSITAEPDGTALPGSTDGDAIARIEMNPDGTVHAGGTIDVFGTDQAETVYLTAGVATLDPSFNKGGDTLILSGDAGTFEAALDGSNVVLTGNGYTISIPAGPGGIDLVFDDDTRELTYDVATEEVLLGSQVITLTIMPLSDIG